QAVAAVRIGVGVADRQDLRRAVHAHAVVPVGPAVLAGHDVVGGDQPVGREVTGTDLVVVHHLLRYAVHALPFDQRANRRRGGRDPHRPGDDVAPHARAHVGAFVAVVFVAVRRQVRAPAADGGAPLDERDPPAAILHA